MENKKNKKPMMPIDDLFSKSFGIYKTVFWQVIAMVILPSLISAIPLVLVFSIIAILTMVMDTSSTLFLVLAAIFGALGIVALIFTIVVNFLANIGAMILVKENDPKLKVMKALKMSKKHGWNFLWASLLAMLFMVLGLVLFVFPAVILGVYFAFVSWTVVCENLGGMDAIKRSKELVKKYWWNVFGRHLLVYIAYWIIFAIPASFVQPDTAAEDLYSLVSQIASWAATPFFLAYSYYMYKDLVRIKGKKTAAK